MAQGRVACTSTSSFAHIHGKKGMCGCVCCPLEGARNGLSPTPSALCHAMQAHIQPKESNQPTSPSSPSSFLLLLFALTSLPSSGIHGLVGSGSPRSNPFAFSRRGRGRNWGREVWEKKERLSSKNVLKNRYACLIPTFTPFFLLIFSKATMNFLGVSFRRGGNSA